MKFLMISKCGEGAHLLHKIMEEGNDVRICIQEQDYKDVWQGILTRTNIGSSWIDGDTIIVFDSSGMGGIADYFRKRGHLVFGGSSWADQLENDRVEVKKLMSDDLGHSTGCSGNLVWAEGDRCSIIESGIALIEDVCKKEGYIGPIDLNTIINEEGLFGLEWTPRFGYDSLPTILQLIEGDIGQLISDLCKGQCSEIKLSEGVAGGVRLTIPPYPLEPPSAREVQKTSPNRGIPIPGLPSKYKDNYYFFEVMPDEDGNFVHSSGTGVILVASSLGDD